MNQNPKRQNTCEVCQQSFNSEAELQAHQRGAHAQNTSGKKQENYDVEREEQRRDKIA